MSDHRKGKQDDDMPAWAAAFLESQREIVDELKAMNTKLDKLDKLDDIKSGVAELLHRVPRGSLTPDSRPAIPAPDGFPDRKK